VLGGLSGRRAAAVRGCHHRPRSHARPVVRWTLALIALTAGALALLAPAGVRAPLAPQSADSPPAPVVLATPAAPTALPPTRLDIPVIDVASTLSEIGVDGSGTLVPPADSDQAGWFAAGPAPGQPGPAVLAGHVDDRTGPAVFYRLEELTAGDQVLVTGADGQPVRFTVTRVAAYPKDAFPTADVYGPTPGPELRLITCGGTFDRSRRSYEDNVVVYARLA
jgi:hypothetical protein